MTRMELLRDRRITPHFISGIAELIPGVTERIFPFKKQPARS